MSRECLALVRPYISGIAAARGWYGAVSRGSEVAVAETPLACSPPSPRAGEMNIAMLLERHLVPGKKTLGTFF
jgi:hypothetical protein